MGYVKYFVYKGKSKVTPISIKELKESPKITNPGAMHSMPDGIFVLNMSSKTFTYEEIEKIEIAINKLKKTNEN
jgi:hypothetical protein